MEKRVDLTGFPVNNNPAPVNWRGKIIHVRPLLEPEEMIATVNDIMVACHDDKHNAEVPEMEEFAIRHCVIMRYSDVLMSSDFREQYRFVFLTDLYETIENKACKSQIAAIRKAVDGMLFRI